MAERSSWGFYKIFISFLIFPFLIVEGKSNLISLDEENWHSMLEGEWMVEFYAPWCPACKSLEPIWTEFSDWSNDLNIKVGSVDVTTSPGLSGRFMVTALPTIFHVWKGEFRQYRGGRDMDSLLSFIENKKWQKLDTIPSWKSPGSIQMSIVSYFFRLSTVLRTVHNQLLEEYGLPTWGSYLIFAVATIIIGAILGLLLICIIDCIYPPKSCIERSSTISSLKEEVEELGDEGDDLIDEEGESGGESPVETQSEGEQSQEEEGGERSASGEEGGGESSPSIRKRRARKAD